MKDKKTVIAIILCIGAVISLAHGLTAGPKTKRKRSARPVSSAKSGAEDVPSAQKIVPTRRLTKKTEFDKWGRNPFTRTGLPEKEGQKLTLNGVIWDESNPVAMINDDIVGIGDKVSGNTVIEIRQSAVVLNDGTKDFELKLSTE